MRKRRKRRRRRGGERVEGGEREREGVKERKRERDGREKLWDNVRVMKIDFLTIISNSSVTCVLLSCPSLDWY